MARKKKNSGENKRRKAVGVVLSLVALLLLVALITHSPVDDAKIVGDIDSQENPFTLKYNNQGGMIGAFLSYLLLGLIGWLAFFAPLGLIFWSLRLFSSEMVARYELNSLILFIISLLGTMIYNIHLLTIRSLSPVEIVPGGYVGKNLTALSIKVVGETGSYIVLSGIILILLILYTSITPVLSKHLRLPGAEYFKKIYRGIINLFSKLSLKRLFTRNQDEDDESDDDYDSGENEEEETEEIADTGDEVVVENEMPGPSKSKSPKRSLTVKSAKPLQIKSIDYSYPGLELLADNEQTSSVSVDPEELNFTARMLKETLETFGVRIEGAIDKYPGPVITRYEFKPGSGIKVNQILNLSDDLALALKAKRIRIIAPIPGKAAVGVEIPNRESQMVLLKDILTSPQFLDEKIRLPLALGKSTSGRPYVTDLTKLPHLLIAGATGSGKSVCMNAVVTSLLYRLHPYQIRFIMIDPKLLELSVYAGIPHLARPVVTKPKRAEKVLGDAVAEMERRYRKLANASVRNIVDYNKKQSSPEAELPYIVIMVDELADLLMSANSSKTEMLITRLAQMARAVGIHLILATQRPSVDVITGLIKANFPARIAFQVSSKVDSRTIIDANGAEKLLGAGDMLFLNPGQPEATRIHGAFVSSDETTEIVNAINEQGLEMMALEGISQATGDTTEKEIDLGDPLFKEACEIVVRHKQGSVSLLQRRLGIGYQRAARLIDKLEAAGIVSPFDGSKAREVMVDKAYLEALFTQAGAGSFTEAESN